MYYFGARYYDPRTSVWQSPDPILGRYLDSGVNNGVYNSFNLGLYGYVALNPLKLVDPTGLFQEDPRTNQGRFKKNNPGTLDARGQGGNTGKTDARKPGSMSPRNPPKTGTGTAGRGAAGAVVRGCASNPVACFFMSIPVLLSGDTPQSQRSSAENGKPLQDHHLINKAQLKGENPHPMAEIAKAAGIDIVTAEWNIEKMPHQGGHTKAYYNAVRQKLDVVYRAYQKSDGSWNATRIESEMKGVAQQISREIKSGDLKLYKQ